MAAQTTLAMAVQQSTPCLINPFGVTLDAANNLYIADSDNNRIRKVETNGIIITVAGNGKLPALGDCGDSH